MNKIELDILSNIQKEPFINQRILSENTGYSLGAVNQAIKILIKAGYLNENIYLTEKAKKLFGSNKPRNAVILAAGFGLRMVPINMTVPKALLEVRGERLIERIIKQLWEVGVKDITVVVGFMKDAFEYLIDEYGVKLVYNSEYASKNNIASLELVIGKVSNTYIIPSDIWCDRNPFHQNELYSWYMVSDMVDDNSEVRVNRKMELVKSPAGKGGNSMVGIAYIAGDTADFVKKQVQTLAKDSAYNNKFWEEALFSEKKMVVQARMVHAVDVVEINTYEQLRDLDSDSRNLQTDALKTISKVLHCRQDEIVDIQILKKGMTNRSFLFSVKGRKYIMRIPGEGTDQLINRQQEAEVYQTIKGKELCEDIAYINPKNGYKIARYIENVRCCDPFNDTDLKICMKKLRKFHAMKLKVNHVFDLFERIDFYESLWNGQPSIYKDYETTKENVLSLRPFIEAHKCEFQLTHIDAVPDNFLFDASACGDLAVQLTDWEYAGMQDKHVDVAMFVIYCMYDKHRIDHLIDLYFEEEGGCDVVTRAKIYCYIAACGLLWSNWCEYKRNLGVEFGEYSLYQYRYGKDFYRYAIALIAKLHEEGLA